MLDREFSALIGAPSSIRDEDITVRLPADVESSVEHINLTLHVRLSRLMAQILTSMLSTQCLDLRMTDFDEIDVYGVGDEFNGSLVRNMQSILHSMAELSHDLTAFLNTHFHGLISRASKMAIRLMLAHHHVGSLHRKISFRKLTEEVCGSDNKTTGDVRSTHAHRTHGETHFRNNITFATCCVSLTMLCRFRPDHSPNTSNLGR